MKIGIDISVLNDIQRTGIAVYTYNLIDAILKINKKDKFVLFGIATYETFNYLKNLPFKNCPNVEMKIFRIPARAFRIGFLLWQKINWPPIESLIGEVDIYHSFNWYLPPQKKGKVVATIFDMTPFLFPQFHMEKTIQLDTVRLNRIKNAADLIVTISENSKRDFLTFAPKKWVEIVYPAVTEKFKVQNNQPWVRRILKKYGVIPGYFLFVGSIEPRKNIQKLIEAFIKGNFDNQLVIVGARGWKNEAINDLIEKNKHNIIITGYVSVDDLPILYNQALCLIYPSFYEGFGMPVLEAMLAGTAVICSRNPSLSEVGGDATLYINPDRIESIRKAMDKISKDSGLKKDLIKRGRAQVEKFSWGKSADKLNNLYQEVAAKMIQTNIKG